LPSCQCDTHDKCQTLFNDMRARCMIGPGVVCEQEPGVSFGFCTFIAVAAPTGDNEPAAPPPPPPPPPTCECDSDNDCETGWECTVAACTPAESEDYAGVCYIPT
jgi:hypothetical protein